MSIDYKGKTVFITGAGGNFGREAALRFGAAGANIAASDMNAEALASLEAELGNQGVACTTEVCDVSQESEVTPCFEAAVTKFGRVDIAVNNAGTTHPTSRFTDIDSATLDRQYAVNIKGVFHCMKVEIPHMLTEGGGVILNVSSVAGLLGAPGLSVYSATKHAVIGLTKSAAVEYAAKGIRINAICPATIDSALMHKTIGESPLTPDHLAAAIPMKRLGQVSEVADAMLWLCSAENSFMTGQAIALDGGLGAQ